MILKAQHHTIVYPFFRWFSCWYTQRHFHQVIIKGDYDNQGKGVLLVANHISWWDGFWAVYLNETVFKRKFHFMMLYEQLKKHWYFNLSGGFSVQNQAKSIIESLNYAAQLVTNPRHIVLLFPQGEIQSIYTQTIEFQKGTEYIIRKAGAQNLQLIWMVSLVDYGSNPKPTLTLYFKEYNPAETTTEELQRAYNEFYQTCINEQKNALK